MTPPRPAPPQAQLSENTGGCPRGAGVGPAPGRTAGRRPCVRRPSPTGSPGDRDAVVVAWDRRVLPG